MLRNLLFIFSILLMGIYAPDVQARTEGIAVVVNEGAITHSDVQDRMGLIIASSGLPNTQQTRDQILPQVVSSLIEEQLMLQEAKKHELAVSPPEIAQGFATIAQQNNFEPAEFEEMLKRGGINVSSMRAQIEAQIAWSKVVQGELKSQVIVTANDIDARLEQLAGAKGKTEFLVSEIFLPVEDIKDETKVQQLAQKLSMDVQSGKVPFFKVAQQFSKAAGSAQGGDLGWVQQGQLSKELELALASMETAGVSDPIRGLAGFHILLLRDKRLVETETLPTRDQVMSVIGLERLQRLQRRHLLDLKSAAFIDNRLDD